MVFFGYLKSTNKQTTCNKIIYYMYMVHPQTTDTPYRLYYLYVFIMILYDDKSRGL